MSDFRHWMQVTLVLTLTALAAVLLLAGFPDTAGLSALAALVLAKQVDSGAEGVEPFELTLDE